jgi:guanylate kinase
MENPRIVILTGPSCAGKTTLETALRERGFAAIRSTTTRPPRKGEVDGEHYYFVSEQDFMDGVREGKFVENVKFNGQRYGITAEEFQRVAAMGKPIVIVAEPNGRDQVIRYGNKHDWDVYPIFVHSDSRTISKRFLLRYAHDVLHGVPNVTENYADRMKLMLTEEREWIRDHRSTPYAYVVDQYDETTQERHIKAICEVFGRMFPDN